jgi:hypothetical protein
MSSIYDCNHIYSDLFFFLKKYTTYYYTIMINKKDGTLSDAERINIWMAAVVLYRGYYSIPLESFPLFYFIFFSFISPSFTKFNLFPVNFGF